MSFSFSARLNELPDRDRGPNPVRSSRHVHGLHHVTAISGDPQENVDFYVGVLGLRMVKRTVNQDSPDTYHLFYADSKGTPGTDLTFFPWPQAPAGRQGTGLVVEIGLVVGEGDLAYWSQRLASAGVEVGRPEERFGERQVRIRDPHGLPLALIETEAPRTVAPWPNSPVPEKHQLRGFHTVRLRVRDLKPSLAFLGSMGYEAVTLERGWQRLEVAGGGSGCFVELQADADGSRGLQGQGTVHHIAFRVADEEEELTVRKQMVAAGGSPTEVIDRFWFRSVYCREPGGILYELATDGPGFARDEDPEHLGEKLILPPWLESRRAEIEAGLPELRSP